MDAHAWDKEPVAAAMASLHAAATAPLAAVRLELALVEDMLALAAATWVRAAVVYQPATAAAFQDRLPMVAAVRRVATVAAAVRQVALTVVAAVPAVPIAVAAVHPAVRQAAPTAVAAAVDHQAAVAMVDHRGAVDVVDKASFHTQFLIIR